MEKKLEFRALNADEVEARIGTFKEGNGLSLLLYKDARVDMQLLDETVGADRWQRKHELIAGNLYCSVGIKFADEWVWKQDVGTESNTEKEKGQASDAFKRACFNWGIGRELYTSPFIWISLDDLCDKDKKNPKYAKFNVTKMVVKDGKITDLEITDNYKNIVYPKKSSYSQPKKDQAEPKVSPRTIDAIAEARKALDLITSTSQFASLRQNHGEALKDSQLWNEAVAKFHQLEEKEGKNGTK